MELQIRRMALSLVVVTIGIGGVLPGPAKAAGCTIPEESFLFEPTLPRLVTVLGGKQPITIVAVGSASTEGRAAGDAAYAWPEQFGLALQKRFPAATIKVVNLGKRRQTAAMMAATFGKDVIPLAPQLVIWETGTVDAVRSVDLDSFRETLESGLTELRSETSVVLMDTQFSRYTSAMIDFEPYERAMTLIADVNDVALFPRHALMRYWSESGEIDLAVAGKEKRQQVARDLYGCIGEALADFVTRRLPEAGSVR